MLEIHHELLGAGPGVPAVLIMGLAADGQAWARVLPRLLERRPVLVLDNRGAGRSACTDGPYQTDVLANDVLAVMDHVGIARAHVAGTSLGGMIAQQLALRCPDRVHSLALISTWAAPPDDIRARIGDALRMLPPGPTLAGFTAQLAATLTHDARARLPAIAAPTLVIAGRDDPIMPIACAHELAAGIPGSRLAVVDGNHGLHLESPVALAELLDGWFAEHDDKQPC